MQWIEHDGGRAAAGFKGRPGDCVARAIAIASGRPYAEVYQALAAGNAAQRVTKRTRKTLARKRTARAGIYTQRQWFKDYMASLGFSWVPTMRVGQGCKVHLHDGELPMGRLVVSLSRHYTAVLDGVIYDTYDPQRETYWYAQPVQDSRDAVVDRVSHRCVYGYWVLQGGQP